jgi:predicted Rossmann-fold nucleotide-binding protein
MQTAHGLGNEDQITEIMEVMKEEMKDDYQKTIIVYTTQETTTNDLNFDSQMSQHQRIFDQSQNRIQQPEC